jgi:NADH-quinone oxidoreductase subunit G/NADP-reducing hydrogenase subunit HndD
MKKTDSTKKPERKPPEKKNDDRKIPVLIDGREYYAGPGESILQTAIKNGIEIPHFCYHEDLPAGASCRTCLVEVGNTGKIVTSCTLKAQDGVAVFTDTPRVKKLRRVNLELLLAGHQKNCPKCQKKLFCRVDVAIKKFGISTEKYSRPEIKEKIHKMCQAAEIDPQLCIACNKCVEICQKIGIGFLEMKGKNTQTHATYTRNPKIDCIYCGQCTVHCPVGSAREQNEIELVEKALRDKNKIVIAQMAPSVRASIGEEFGLPVGTDLTGQIYTAFRKLGFDKIFDVNMGADITTIVEATELADRIKKNLNLPMFTSCCPAWVKYVEFYHPELLHHFTRARSPQIHSGGAYKTWWAEKEKIDPKKIVVVSFMPCTSKKYEARHKKFKIKGMQPVDYVLTTREFAVLLKKRKIDLPNLQPGKVDLAGTFSGAAAIYGASGGVMESALRTAYFKLTGKELEKIDFKKIRGIEGIKTAKVKIGSRTLKVAVAATAANAAKIISELKQDKHAYDYVEVMGCPGGCIGGGGQPIPTTLEIVKKRIAALYKIDAGMKIRKAHLNPVVNDFFENYIERLPVKKQKKILNTTYSRKKKFE